MESNNIDSILKAKDLLNKLLKEHLDNKLAKLEINNQKELKSISLIKMTSKKLLKNVLQYSKISMTKDSKVTNRKLSKLNIHLNHTKSQMNFSKFQNNKKGELYSILKNRRSTHKRNKEDSLSVLLGNTNTNNTLQSKVSFIDKSKKAGSLTITPVLLNKNKTFISHTTSTRREKKSINKTVYDNLSSFETRKFIKLRKKSSKKNLFDKYVKIKNINEKIKKLYKSTNNISFNSSVNTDNKSNSTINNKKSFKTSLNFYSKNNKNNFYKSVDSNSIKDNKKQNKKIIETENNLKTLCDSLLDDVNKDELLINNSKIYIKENLDNEIELRKISFSKENKIKKKEINGKYYNNLNICIQYILKYLSINDIFSLALTKKEILKIVMSIQIKNIKQSINEINIIFKNKNININDSSLTKKLKPFELNINSIKAISLLNSISKANFIKSIMAYKNQNIKNNNVIKKILLIFDIYFIALGKKKILNSFNGNNNKIEYICNYFKNNKNKSIGTIVENDLSGRKFDDYIISSLYEYSHEYIKIINPTYYKKLNKDIAILVFLIKNILDYIGLSYIESNSKILNNNKNNEQKILLIYKSRINVQNFVLNKYNNILTKFN